jgi:hypothetical protein
MTEALMQRVFVRVIELKVNGIEIMSGGELQEQVSKFKPGR